MRLQAAPETLMAGVRCVSCQQFLRVAEGAVLPRCYCREQTLPEGQTLEFHVEFCLENCGRWCSCPCHAYRPKPEETRR